MYPITTPDPNAALGAAVTANVLTGWRVEAQPTAWQVVMIRGRNVNHVLHLLLSVFTLGLWIPMWLLLAFTTKESRAVLTAHSDGTVSNSLVHGAPGIPWYRDRTTLVTVGGVAVLLMLILVFG